MAIPLSGVHANLALRVRVSGDQDLPDCWVLLGTESGAEAASDAELFQSQLGRVVARAIGAE
eukprot:5084749-Pyramimonas_sp.AAC.1